MEIDRDHWLSEVFCYPVFRVSGSIVSLRDLRSHYCEHSSAFYYSKLATDRVDQVRKLISAGFYVVDTAVTLGRSGVNELNGPVVAGIDVSLANPGTDGDTILEIAEASFHYSRFHLDPLIPAGLADRVKRSWVESYLTGQRGECLWVAHVNADAAGFLAVLSVPVGESCDRVIDLIAVSQGFQRRGVARALIEAFIKNAAPRSERLRVGTQAANIPSIRLYEQAGFFIDQTQYVLHLHVKSGVPCM